MNKIIDFFLVGIFAIFIAGLFIIFIQELFWLLGYFGFKNSLVIDVSHIIDLSFAILTKLTGLEIDGLFAAFGATIIFAMPTLIMYIFIFLFILLELTIGLEIDDPFTGLGVGIILAIPTLIIFIFILIIFAKITMKFLDNFKNKTYSKSFYFIVFLFFNCIYLFIFLGFSHSKFSEFSNENLLFLVLAFCLGLISTYLTKIKFFKGEKYV